MNHEESGTLIEESEGSSSSQRQKIFKALIFDEIVASGESEHEGRDFSNLSLHPEELGMHVI